MNKERSSGKEVTRLWFIWKTSIKIHSRIYQFWSYQGQRRRSQGDGVWGVPLNLDEGKRDSNWSQQFPWLLPSANMLPEGLGLGQNVGEWRCLVARPGISQGRLRDKSWVPRARWVERLSRYQGVGRRSITVESSHSASALLTFCVPFLLLPHHSRLPPT